MDLFVYDENGVRMLYDTNRFFDDGREVAKFAGKVLVNGVPKKHMLEYLCDLKSLPDGHYWVKDNEHEQYHVIYWSNSSMEAEICHKGTEGRLLLLDNKYYILGIEPVDIIVPVSPYNGALSKPFQYKDSLYSLVIVSVLKKSFSSSLAVMKRYPRYEIPSSGMLLKAYEKGVLEDMSEGRFQLYWSNTAYSKTCNMVVDTNGRCTPMDHRQYCSTLLAIELSCTTE